MKSILVGWLLNGALGKDKDFYCEVCRALIEESHWKVSEVGRHAPFLIVAPPQKL